MSPLFYKGERFISGTTKIAVVIPNDPERIERGEYLKASMKVKDFLFDYFTDFEKAIEWLSEIEPLYKKRE